MSVINSSAPLNSLGCDICGSRDVRIRRLSIEVGRVFSDNISGPPGSSLCAIIPASTGPLHPLFGSMVSLLRFYSLSQFSKRWAYRCHHPVVLVKTPVPPPPPPQVPGHLPSLGRWRPPLGGVPPVPRPRPRLRRLHSSPWTTQAGKTPGLSSCDDSGGRRTQAEPLTSENSASAKLSQGWQLV